MGEPPLRNFTINFGPQHPAAHGVLRLDRCLLKTLSAASENSSFQNADCPSSEFLRLRAAQIKGGSGSFAGLSETE
jgi:hypothetical protein